MTRQENYDQIEQVRERIIELLHYQKNRLAYRKRTEIAVDTEAIEQSGKHWVSEIEKNRNINWQGSWTRVDVVLKRLS